MWTSPHKIRVAVLRGGSSHEYDHSLTTGKFIIDNLPDDVEPIDVLVSREGRWHEGGFVREPNQVLRSVDLVWNALHGAYGEDGKLQGMIEQFGVPLTGSASVQSAVGMNKILQKKLFTEAGLKTPHYIAIKKPESLAGIQTDIIDRIHKSMPFPIIIKPVDGGSSIGLSLVQNSRGVAEALEKAFSYSDDCMAEEFIDGREVMSGVVEGFRGEPHYALFPTSPTGLAITSEESESAQTAARQIHQALGLKDYSQADFIIHPKRGLFVLEVNTLPKLHEESTFVQSLKSVGSNIKEFISHTLGRVMKK